MITLYITSSLKELSSKDVDDLATLWGQPIQNQQAFFDYDEVPEFYTLFFTSLDDRSVDIDWKWEPDDIFWQLKKLLPDQHLELISSHEEGEGHDTIYNVEFSSFDVSFIDAIRFDNPDKLLDEVNKLIAPRQFIAINFLEDRYSWLLVPPNFNVSRFCEITGMVTEAPGPAPIAKAPFHINSTGKQSAKIFFKPIIYTRQNGEMYQLAYKYSTGGYGSWAGRVLPGQTIREGVAIELRKTLDYKGRFEIGAIAFSGYAIDKQEEEIERHNITITLLDELTATTALGMQIVLTKVS